MFTFDGLTIALKCDIINVVNEKELDIMNRIIKVIENVAFVLCIIFAVWFLFSFVEVNMKNLTENPVYSSWNFFEIFLKILTKT